MATESLRSEGPASGEAVRKYFAELIGTFVLVLGGVGSAVLAARGIGPLGVSLAFGLALLAMVYAIGPISGCHVNPAVTLGLYLTRKMKRRHAAGYVVGQVLGAILAAGVILFLAKAAAGGYDASAAGLGANGYADHSPGGFGVLAAFVAETLLTLLLVFTVLGATDHRAPVGFAGLAIGLVLTLVHLVGIPITNTSVNPARSIGPALFVGDWALRQLWLFIAAPLLGSALAAAAHLAVHAPRRTITAREAEQVLEHEGRERVATARESPAGATR